MRKGDRFVAFGDRRPAEQLFVEVTRVAKDGSWADISVCTWAVKWAKRQKLNERGRIPYAVSYNWTEANLTAQQEDHMAKLREQGILV